MRRKPEQDQGSVTFSRMFGSSLMDNVIGNLSEDDDVDEGVLSRRRKRQGNMCTTKRMKQVPDFEIEDIMGEFDLDDQGNFIILRNDITNRLEDSQGNSVNPWGYLLDSHQNVVDRNGQVIFFKREMDETGEIP